MSLKLEVIENKFTALPASLGPLFSYSKSLVDLKQDIEKLAARKASGSYGPKTIARVDALLEKWQTRVEAIHPFPPTTGSTTDVILWTLERSGFAVVDGSKSSDQGSNYSLKLADTLITLKVVRMRNYTICHLDTFTFVDSGDSDPMHVPLRFALSCIYPLTTHCPVPEFNSLPPEVVVEMMRFMTIEEMGQFARLSKSVSELASSDSVWSYVYSHLEDYSSSCGSGLVNERTEPFKTLVKNQLVARQRARMTRFSRTVEQSHWAAPAHVMEPIRGTLRVTRRLPNVMDDLNLF